MKEIRTLNAAEIDCRIGQSFASDKSVSILLYKNARVDMAILDELVGAENWQRDHKEIKGNLYCGVGINTERGWVWKWDCGTESNTEPEKGESSDSFKRACVCWGIGRELYTAPRIVVPCSDKEWNNGKPRVWLRVDSIKYNEFKEITDLEIKDGRGVTRFVMRSGRTQSVQAQPSQPVAPVQRAGKDFCPEKYPNAWNSAVAKGLTKVEIEEHGYTISEQNWQRYLNAVNS